jgi:hypothetical protein
MLWFLPSLAWQRSRRARLCLPAPQ